nr:MAG TPA: hypothetical protein [Caudoviricetes sp.]
MSVLRRRMQDKSGRKRIHRIYNMVRVWKLP